MEPGSSLPQSQQPATCPYPEPQQPQAMPPHPTSRTPILISPSHPLLADTSTKILYATMSPVSATRPDHLILLDVITRKIFDEQYRS